MRFYMFTSTSSNDNASHIPLWPFPINLVWCSEQQVAPIIYLSVLGYYDLMDDAPYLGTLVTYKYIK